MHVQCEARQADPLCLVVLLAKRHAYLHDRLYDPLHTLVTEYVEVQDE